MLKHTHCLHSYGVLLTEESDPLLAAEDYSADFINALYPLWEKHLLFEDNRILYVEEFDTLDNLKRLISRNKPTQTLYVVPAGEERFR